MRSTPSTLLRGAAAGVAASVVQAAIGKAEDLAFLPPHESADIAPRLVDRLAKKAGLEPERSTEWVLGTVFHVGYGAAWGMAYGLAQERLRLEPAVGGLLLGGLIYGITFPTWGGAVQTDTERPPEARTKRMEAVAVSVAFGFGLATALIYGELARER